MEPQEPSSTSGSKSFWLRGWACEAGQTDRTICVPERRFGQLGLAECAMALPRNGTKQARVRIAARVAGGPSLPFLRRMPDAELALGLPLDLSEEVSNSSQVSRASRTKASELFLGQKRPRRNAGPLISVNIGRPPLPTKSAYSITNRGIQREKELYFGNH